MDIILGKITNLETSLRPDETLRVDWFGNFRVINAKPAAAWLGRLVKWIQWALLGSDAQKAIDRALDRIKKTVVPKDPLFVKKSVRAANFLNSLKIEFDFAAHAAAMVKQYKQKAEEEDAEAQTNLGLCYYFGHGVEKDVDEAARWFEEAALQDYGEAQFYYGQCCDTEEEKAVWYQKAARQGYAGALFQLGQSAFQAGDTSEGLKLYQQAAEKGSPFAQNALGEYHEKHCSINLAFKWLKKGAEQGLAEAQYNLGNWYIKHTKDAKRGMEWHLKAANQGLAAAQYEVGWNSLAAEQRYAPAEYKMGVWCASQKKQEEALKWFQLSADQGYGEAQCALGDHYRQEKNYDEALKWYLKAAGTLPNAKSSAGAIFLEKGEMASALYWYNAAAELKDPEAYYQLGVLAKDPAEAFRWYSKAAFYKHVEAYVKLGEHWLFTAVDETVSRALGLANLHKAAALGHPKAKYLLGLWSEQKEKSIANASVWYREAADKGDPQAKEALERIYTSIIQGAV